MFRDNTDEICYVHFLFIFSAELAFCGEVFDLTFVLQYFRFIPEIEEIKFFLQVSPVFCDQEGWEGAGVSCRVPLCTKRGRSDNNDDIGSETITS